MKENFILVEFKDGKTSFDINTGSDTMIFMAIAGLEGYLAGQTGLDMVEIRELVDESKVGVIVKPKVVEIIEDGK